LVDPFEGLRSVKRLQQVLRLLEGEAIDSHQPCMYMPYSRKRGN
jgi:hypothetical protein